MEKQFSPRGRAYYWIAGNSGPHDAKPGSDGYALINNYVSVTPINLDLTCDELLKPLEARKGLVDKRLAVVTGGRGTFGRPAAPAVGIRRSVNSPVAVASPRSASKAPPAPRRAASHHNGSGSEVKSVSAAGAKKKLKR